MFAEMGLLFPHLPEVGHHGLPLEEELFCRLLPHGSATSNLVQTTTISGYDLGAEGDLFRAPEPIMEESVMELDYISAAMSMMCNGDGVICAAEAFGVAAAAAEPAALQDQQLFADDLYESKNSDLTWAEPTAEEVYSDLPDVKLPSVQIGAESMLLQNDSFVVDEESAQKSLISRSSGCCCMLEQMSGGGGFVRPAELFDFQGLDLAGVFGMRHAYSDGDIQSNLVQTTTISGYDLGAEGDLFRGPEPIMEESVMELDYISAAMSMMCNGDGVICAAEAFGVAAGATADPAAQDQHLFADDLYESKNSDLTWAKPKAEEVYSDLLDVKLPSLQIGAESMLLHNDSFVVDHEESAQKSLISRSSGCCYMLEQMSEGGGFVRPAELFDFQGLDLGGVFGMRHAYSDGDIQAVAYGHMNHFSGSTAHLPFERLLTIDEERRQKLSRYRKKRTKRNFGRNIKYACRKASAASQPRVRGRFAKTEELDTSKPSK